MWRKSTLWLKNYFLYIGHVGALCIFMLQVCLGKTWFEPCSFKVCAASHLYYSLVLAQQVKYACTHMVIMFACTPKNHMWTCTHCTIVGVTVITNFKEELKPGLFCRPNISRLLIILYKNAQFGKT